MSLPRERHLGVTYFVTRRCERREMRLRPDAGMNAAFAVALVDAASRYGCDVVALCVMSNHYHMVIHDEGGRVSELLRDVHATVARYGNASQDAGSVAFWDGQQTDVVELGDAEAIVEKVAYCLANPVRAGLVERPEDWPGVYTRVEDVGTWRGPVFQRPGQFFRTAGPVSEVVELCCEAPPMAVRAFGLAGFKRRARARLDALVIAAHRDMVAAGRSFAGADAVIGQSVWSKPTTPDAREVQRRGVAMRGRRTVAARSRARLRALVERVVAFRRRHRAAMAQLLCGMRAVVFPAGTWQAWRHYGVARAGEYRYSSA